MQIKIKTPAKINLTLEILNRRSDGFHEIASVMQTINLYDYLEFNLIPANDLEIVLKGTSTEIPYNNKNIIYKAIELFYSLNKNLKPYKIVVNIKKNIPVMAGLGGGSSNAAGTIWALNKLLKTNLQIDVIDKICAQLGSDLNVCYYGGACYAEGRGEKVTRINSMYSSELTIVKPLNFGITAKDGYLMYDDLNRPPKTPLKTLQLKKALLEGEDIIPYIWNDLEIAPLKKFSILQQIKAAYPDSFMTGSGSAFFILKNQIPQNLLQSNYQIIQGLSFTSEGVCEV